MKTRTEPAARRVAARRGGLWLATAAIAATVPAQALIIDLHPYVSAGYAYDTNLFRTQDAAQAQVVTDGGPRGGSVYRGRIGTELVMSQSLQRLEVDGEYGYDKYEDYGDLDGSRYKVKARADLAAGRTLGATLTGSRERSLAPYYGGTDRGIAPSLQTDTRGAAELYYRITPEISIKPSVDISRQRQSLDTLRDADLSEDGRQIAVEYARATLSAAGLKYREVDGSYPDRLVAFGSGREKDYRQRTYAGYARYTPSGLSQFRAELGYTRRSHDDPSVPDYSGFTGTLGYRRVISGKTYGEFEVFRNLQSIDEVGINFVEETGVSSVFNYAWSVKTSLVLGYEYLEDRFLGSSSQDPANNDRVDAVQLLRAGVEYAPTSRVLVTPQLRYEDHHSTRDDRSYNYGLFGVELRYRY